MAVYNVKPYLRECLENLKVQTLREAEFIVVDDGSTDGSSEICDEFARSDSRFRVIHHEKNRGLLRARKTGILAARGKYIALLDGDDHYVGPESLSTLLRLMEEHGADILRFEPRCFGEDLQSVQVAQNFLTIKTDVLLQTGLEAAQMVYVRGEYGWTVIFRCYRAEVLRKVAAYISEVHFVCAEDVFIVFLAHFFAQRAAVVKSEPIYAYRIGSGVSTGAVTMAKFPMYAKEVIIVRWIEAALKAEGGGQPWFDVLEGLKQRLLSIAAGRLPSLLPEDMKAGFDLQVASGFLPDFVQALAAANSTMQQQGEMARNLYGAASLKRRLCPVRTAGVLLPAKEDAEAMRETLRQVAMLRSLGCQVVMLVEADGADEPALPEGVECIELPSRMKDGRAQALANAVQRQSIDVVLHHQSSSKTLLWDILVAKLSGASVMVQLHELLGRRFLQQPCADAVTFESIRPYLYRLADRLFVSNGAFKSYFDAFGCCATVCPPPLAMEGAVVPEADPQRRSGVLWLGRGQDLRQQGEEVLRVMERLSMLAPETPCRMGSLEDDPEAEAGVLKFIRERHLEKSVQWLGRCTAVEVPLSQCRVFLMTSVFEAFSSRLAAAMLSGAPVVAYDAPHLDLLQTKKGCRVVRRGDVEAVAVNAAAILSDEALFHRLSSEARTAAEAFYRQHDLRSMLQSVLEGDLVQEAPNGRLSHCLDLMADVVTQGMRQIERRQGADEERRRRKKIHAGRVMKYALLGKLALTHDKREHYRNKLRKLFA